MKAVPGKVNVTSVEDAGGVVRPRSCNGERTLIRPAIAGDAPAQRAFFRSLSKRSRYQRFLCACEDIPASHWDRLRRGNTHAQALFIAEFMIGGLPTVIAEACYVVDPCDCTSCEFAMSVADEWQGLGLGWVLFARLRASAVVEGIKSMHADMLATNVAALRLARKIGLAIAMNPEEGRLCRVMANVA
jgi:acetyltransferase